MRHLYESLEIPKLASQRHQESPFPTPTLLYLLRTPQRCTIPPVGNKPRLSATPYSKEESAGCRNYTAETPNAAGRTGQLVEVTSHHPICTQAAIYARLWTADFHVRQEAWPGHPKAQTGNRRMLAFPHPEGHWVWAAATLSGAWWATRCL